MNTINATEPKEAYNEYLASHAEDHNYCCSFLGGSEAETQEEKKRNFFKKIKLLFQKLQK